jgi:hypothetical protein
LARPSIAERRAWHCISYEGELLRTDNAAAAADFRAALRLDPEKKVDGSINELFSLCRRIAETRVLRLLHQ